MNETILNILQHRSIRKFHEKSIDDGQLNLILKAACNGSTMGGLQLYSIIVTQDKEMMQKMAPFHFSQPIATNAPLILTFCADFHRFDKYCTACKVDTDAYHNLQAYQWAVTDAIIAAQNACVAAESLGIGLCWLGTITYNVAQFIEIMQLPEHVIPVACIAMGYPDENPELTDKLPMDAIVHQETYHDYDSHDIVALFKNRETHPRNIQIVKENNMQNLAEDYVKRRYKKEDNEFFSQVLKETLQKQGFNI